MCLCEEHMDKYLLAYNHDMVGCSFLENNAFIDNGCCLMFIYMSLPRSIQDLLLKKTNTQKVVHNLLG